MEKEELINYLRSEGDRDKYSEFPVQIPTIDLNERVLSDIADQIESEGLEHLVSNFGTVSNAFIAAENGFVCSADIKEEACKVINAALVRIQMGIQESQGNVKNALTNVDKQTRHRYRKYMAVTFYIINKCFDDLERAVTAETHNISLQLAKDTNSKRRKKQREEDDEVDSPVQFWFTYRRRLVEQIWKIIAPPMDEVWENNPNPDGYNFMRLLTLALCSSIKNKSKQLRNMDAEMETMFDILGVLISKHGEGTGIIPRLIPLLKGSEETAKIIAIGINHMLQICQDQAPGMVLQILTETYDVYSTRFDKESGQERGFHTFLTQLCSLQQKGALHSLPIIMQFLDAESHTVRNAVLVIAQQLMIWTWDQLHGVDPVPHEEVDERSEERKQGYKNIRETLLNEILLKYMRDINSLVRSKAINLITELVKPKPGTTDVADPGYIFPSEAVDILRNIKLRLLDKTVTTRKAATSLVVELVNKYPALVFPADQYEKKREEKLLAMSNVIRDDEQNPALALFFIVKEFFVHIQLYGFVLTKELKEVVTSPEAGMAHLEACLKEEKYFQACEAMYYCCQKFSVHIEQLLAAVKRGDDNEADEQLYLTFFKAMHSPVFPQELNSLELNEINYVAPKKIEDDRVFLEFITYCYRMQQQMEFCQPSLRKLLELGTTTDKKEAVLFYATICEKGYKPSHGVTVSIINALAQLNSEELPSFVEPFRKIFIGRESIGPVGFTKKLIELVQSLSETVVESLSGMIGEMYRSGIIAKECVNILWDAFSLAAAGNWEPADSRGAGYILGIIGEIDKKVITTNLKQLIDVGLGQRGLEDYELAKVTLQAILFGCRTETGQAEEPPATIGRGKAKTVKTVAQKATETIKFQPNHELFPKIIDLIETGLKVEGTYEMNLIYPKVVELSMQIIYRMCTKPSEIIEKILPNIHGYIFASHQAASQDSEGQSQQPSSQQSQGDLLPMSNKLLFRYMSFGKAFLGAHIMYYDVIVPAEIKIRKQALEKAKKKNKHGSNVRPRASKASTGANNSTNSSIMNQSNEAELDVMIGNIGFDAEADQIKTYVGSLLDKGFFRQFRVHVFLLAQKFNDIKSLNLKIAIVQALTKLMLVCEQSVVSSIPVLINLWEANEHFAVKTEILKNSVRLTVKFPNQMEKMNECYSAGLAHNDVRVRKACMDYIQYLALSDLLKVREQLSDTAACLCDENFELREMARDFINQIAEKDNVLQNSIPDIISRLSGRDDISQENFQIIMKIILTKIKKEKQLGGLIDRIVGRFKGVVSVRVCQDTAYCLTQIQHNEKTFKILKDNLPHYADKLADNYVWDFFQEIITTFKKLNLKTRLEDWEKELEECRNKCVALHNAEQAAKKKDERPQRRRMVQESSSEDEGEGEENGKEGNAEGESMVEGSDGEEEQEQAMDQDQSGSDDDDGGQNEDDENEEDEADGSEEEE